MGVSGEVPAPWKWRYSSRLVFSIRGLGDQETHALFWLSPKGERSIHHSTCSIQHFQADGAGTVPTARALLDLIFGEAPGLRT